jgi:hypothetical protein
MIHRKSQSHHEAHEDHEGLGFDISELRALRDLRGELRFPILVAVLPR